MMSSHLAKRSLQRLFSAQTQEWETRGLWCRGFLFCVFCHFPVILISVCVYIRLFSITQLIADVFVKGAFTVTTLESPESVAVCVCVCGGFTHTQEELILV